MAHDCMRRWPAMCVWVIATVMASTVSALAQSSPDAGKSQTLQRICGLVVEPECSDSSPDVMTLAVTTGLSVSVESTSTREVPALRLLAGALLFRSVCLIGHVVERQTEHDLARFTIASVADVTPTGRKRPKGWDDPEIATPCDQGTQLPSAKTQVPPNYTSAALGAQIQGTAMVQALVDVDGQVKAVRLLRSVDSRLGLDEEALLAVRKWRFGPPTKAGAPVPMAVTIGLTFTVKK